MREKKFVDFFSQAEEGLKEKLTAHLEESDPRETAVITFMSTLVQFVKKTGLTVSFPGTGSRFYENNHQPEDDDLWEEAVKPFLNKQTFLDMEYIVVNRKSAAKMKDQVSGNRSFTFLSADVDLFILFPTGRISGVLSTEQTSKLYVLLTSAGIVGASAWY